MMYRWLRNSTRRAPLLWRGMGRHYRDIYLETKQSRPLGRRYSNALVMLLLLLSLVACGRGVLGTLSLTASDQSIGLDGGVVGFSLSYEGNRELLITTTSSEQSVVPDGNIRLLAGEGVARSLEIVPQAAGVTTLTIEAREVDGNAQATVSFVLTVVPAPRLEGDFFNTVITIDQDSRTERSFSASDAEGNAIEVRVSSNNPGLIDAAGLRLTQEGTTYSLTIEPRPGQSGEAIISIVADDGISRRERSFTLRVSASNTAPRFTSSPVTTASVGSVYRYPISASDAEGDSLTITAQGLPAWLTLSATTSSNGQATAILSGTPAAANVGTVSVVLEVSDGRLSDNQSFTITVRASDIDAGRPSISALPASRTIAQGQSTGDIPFVISYQGDIADLTLRASSSNPLLVPDGAGTNNIRLGGSGVNRILAITPDPNRSGIADISIIVSDPQGRTASATLRLTVEAARRPPTISTIDDQLIGVDSSTPPLPFVVADPDGSVNRLRLSASSSNPELVPSPLPSSAFGGSGANRSLVVTPSPGRSGVTVISIVVENDEGASSSSSFTLQVNARPTIGAIADQQVEVGGRIEGLAVDVNDDGDPDALTLRGSSSNTSVLPNANIRFAGAGTRRFISLEPAANVSGISIVTITVTDALGASASSSFRFTVLPDRDAPIISGLPDELALAAGQSSATANFTIRLPDSVDDVSLADLIVSASTAATSPPSNPRLLESQVSVSGEAGSRSVSVTPPAGQSGQVQIVVTVRYPDTTRSASSQSFVLQVAPAENRPPTIGDISDPAAIDQRSSTPAIAFSVNDPNLADQNPDPAVREELTVTASSSNPALTPPNSFQFSQVTGRNTSRSLTITPAEDQFGEAIITVTVRDRTGASDETSFTLRVSEVRLPPSLGAISNQALQVGTSSELSFSFDPGDVALADIEFVVTSSNTEVLPLSAISVSPGNLRLEAGQQTGSSTVTLRARDRNDPDIVSAPRSFVVTVSEFTPPRFLPIANPAPIGEDEIIGVPFSVDPGDVALADLQVNVVSVSVEPAASSATLPSANVSASFLTRPNGQVRIQPVPNQSAEPVTATITLRVSDGGALSSQTSFRVTINPVNEAPSIAAIDDQAVALGSSLELNFSVSDPDPGDVLSVSASAEPALAGLTVEPASGAAGTRTLRSGSLNQAGSFTVTLTVQDAQGESGQTSFVLEVISPPSITPEALPAQTINEGAAEENNQSAPIEFTISPANLGLEALQASSNNPAAVADEAASFSFAAVDAAAGRYSLVVRPVQQVRVGEPETATITVRVADPRLEGSTAQASLQVTVQGVNQPPSIAPIEDATVPVDGSVEIALSVDDPDPDDSLTITASSSDVSLIPADGLLVDPVTAVKGTARSLTITPAAGASGTAEVTVTVDDGSETASQSFTVTVSPLPVINPPLADQVTDKNQTVDSSIFSISSSNPPLAELTLSVSSSNPTLLPEGNITVNTLGSDSATSGSRSLSLTPANNQIGSTTVTVTLTGGLEPVSDSFTLTVEDVNLPPTISGLPSDPVEITQDSSSNPIPFTIGDPDTALEQLTVTASSSNPSLLPDANISLAGSGANRTVTVTPAAFQTGTAEVTITVNDNDTRLGAGSEQSTSASFTLEVMIVPLAPVACNASLAATNENTAVDFGGAVTATPPISEPCASAGAGNFEFWDPNGDVLGSTPGTGVMTIQMDEFSTLGARISPGGALGEFRYDPTVSIRLQQLTENEAITDTFTYTVTDSRGLLSNRATISVRVEGRPTERSGIPTDPPTGLRRPTDIQAVNSPSGGAAFLYIADRTANSVFVVDMRAGPSRPKVAVPLAGLESPVPGGLRNPEGVAVRVFGNIPSSGDTPRPGNAVEHEVFIADTGNHRIIRINRFGDTESFVGPSGATGDSGAGFGDFAGNSARFNRPAGMVIVDNTLYVADSGNHRIRRVNLVTRAVSTFAGSGTVGRLDGSSSEARFSFPQDLIADAEGNIYVVEKGDGAGYRGGIRRISRDGNVSTVSLPPEILPNNFLEPTGITIDAIGTLYVSYAASDRILLLRVDASGNLIEAQQVRGVPQNPPGTWTTTSWLAQPEGIAVDGQGVLYVVNAGKPNAAINNEEKLIRIAQ